MLLSNSSRRVSYAAGAYLGLVLMACSVGMGSSFLPQCVLSNPNVINKTPFSPSSSTTRLFVSSSPYSSSSPRKSTYLPDIRYMRIQDIRQELESYGIRTHAFFEKSDMVKALREARASRGFFRDTSSGGADSNGYYQSARSYNEQQQQQKHYANSNSFHNNHRTYNYRRPEPERRQQQQQNRHQQQAQQQQYQQQRAQQQQYQQQRAQQHHQQAQQQHHYSSYSSSSSGRRTTTTRHHTTAQHHNTSPRSKQKRTTTPRQQASIYDEMQRARHMATHDLRRTLDTWGIPTAGLRRHEDFLRAYAEAVVLGVEEDTSTAANEYAGSSTYTKTNDDAWMGFEEEEVEMPFDPAYRDVIVEQMLIGDPRAATGRIIDIELRRMAP